MGLTMHRTVFITSCNTSGWNYAVDESRREEEKKNTHFTWWVREVCRHSQVISVKRRDVGYYSENNRKCATELVEVTFQNRSKDRLAVWQNLTKYIESINNRILRIVNTRSNNHNRHELFTASVFTHSGSFLSTPLETRDGKQNKMASLH